jgi:DNA-binding NarL/FixJ family response regulator
LIRIILAEDHNIVRNGIKSILDNEAGIEVVFEAENGNQVISWLSEGNKADLVLSDMNMPELSGINMLKQLKDTVDVLILSMLDHENYVIEAIKAGARGYLLKNVSREELLFAIKYIAKGGQYICSELSFKMLNKLAALPETVEPYRDPNIELSEREIEVLVLIAEGYTNNEIADKLFTSRRTVEGHRQSLIEKTGVRNTPALIKFAVMNGIIK